MVRIPVKDKGELMLKEFREFALRGNVMDMAIGIIIGAAFGPIVKSLVNDVIMPPIGLLMGHVDFSNLFIPLNGQHYASLAAAKEAGAATINYGVFINTIINFIIVVFAVFFLVKVMNAAKRKEEEAPKAPPAPPADEILLTEIRDILKAKK